MTIFIAVTLWLLSGQAYLEQKSFNSLTECLTYGQAKTMQLMANDADILYGSCHPIPVMES